jgi:H2-forming N5,N10-methylenetetrahydromethanopterin dehydrogenase-like enzyme
VKNILLVISMQFLIVLNAMASTVNLEGVTWIMRPIDGDPVNVSKIETDKLEDGTDVLIYTTPDGKESYVELLKVKNIEDVVQMLTTGNFVQDYKKISPVVGTPTAGKKLESWNVNNYSHPNKTRYRKSRGWRRRR